ncbi:HAD-IA family hydrolase [Aliarcobacter butzleri]|uniref:HAD family hydrolase n=1 Tax=Aliarcobacter butzleri TaxID=28197 RepID=UPI00344CE62D
MIKNILWDFDGVILDSMKIKGFGFTKLFEKYDIESIKLLEDYHYKHGGVSRFEKIKYFFNEILQKNITEDEISILAKKFGKIIEQRIYDKSNLIHDSLDFIKNNYFKYNFHIVSGAEHRELNSLCKYFDLKKYFITINGSPIKKNILIKSIIEKYDYNKEETILIGDAITDYNAAKDNNISFYGYNNLELVNLDKYIDDFLFWKVNIE